MSPVARADCKLATSGTGPIWVDVLFSSKDELDDFISSLVFLRDAQDFDHSHLQDHVLSNSSSSASTEIVFHLPDSCFDSLRDEMIQDVEKRLKSGKD